MPIIEYPPTTETDVTGLTAALASKLNTSQLKTTLTGNLDTDIASVKSINTALSGKLDKYLPYDNGSSLAIDGANGTYFKIATGINSSFTFSNLATGVVYGILIKNSALTDDITITLPNTADILPALISTVDIPASSYIEFSVFYDGTNRIWQISEELS